MVLLYVPDYKNEPEGIEQLLPWSDFIKEHSTGLIDVENITAENHAPLLIYILYHQGGTGQYGRLFIAYI